MASKNDITLDVIATKAVTPAYAENYDKIDHSIKLETDRPIVSPKDCYRYLVVTPKAHSFVSMNYHHPDHNLRLTFDQEGILIGAEILK